MNPGFQSKPWSEIGERFQRKKRRDALISLSGFGTDKTTSLSELAVMYAGPKVSGKNGTIEYQRNRSASPDIDDVPDVNKPPKPKPTPASKAVKTFVESNSLFVVVRVISWIVLV